MHYRRWWRGTRWVGTFPCAASSRVGCSSSSAWSDTSCQDPIFRLSGLEVVLWLVLIGSWAVGYAFNRRAAEANDLIGSRDEAARRAVADERSRIARELHDVVGHGISVAVLQLVGAVGLLDDGQSGAARDRVLAAERSAREALAEMRRLLGMLDGDTQATLSPQPGLGHLDRLLADTTSAGAALNVTVHGDPVPLPTGLDLAAFRILQEALTNVLKHATPPSADVVISYGQDRLSLKVRDHGRGATHQVGATGGGRGIAGMRERARLYNGDLRVGPCDEGGYLVSAWLPVMQP